MIYQVTVRVAPLEWFAKDYRRHGCHGNGDLVIEKCNVLTVDLPFVARLAWSFGVSSGRNHELILAKVAGLADVWLTRVKLQLRL